MGMHCVAKQFVKHLIVDNKEMLVAHEVETVYIPSWLMQDLKEHCMLDGYSHKDTLTSAVFSQDDWYIPVETYTGEECKVVFTRDEEKEPYIFSVNKKFSLTEAA